MNYLYISQKILYFLGYMQNLNYTKSINTTSTLTKNDIENITIFQVINTKIVKIDRLNLNLG